MKIALPQLEHQGDQLIYSADLTRSDGEQFTLTFQVPSEYESWVSTRSDAALVVALLPAMRRGEDIEVEGTVTDELLFQLQGDYQALLRKQKRKLHRISITAENPAPRSLGRAKASSPASPPVWTLGRCWPSTTTQITCLNR